MGRKLYTLVLLALFSSGSAFAQTGTGTLQGKVTDKGNNEELPFVNVVLYQNGNIKAGATTGMDGRYRLTSITPGKYDLEVKFVGYQPVRIEGIIISDGKIAFKDVALSETSTQLEDFEVITYKVPLIDKDGGASGGTVTRDDIAKMPGRSAQSIATTVGGVQSDANGNISSVRGARSDATFYFIDGIKVRGSTGLPKSAIEEVSVITGGLPANYGDATGGIISITTRGPSSFYFGGIDILTSGFGYGRGDNKNVFGLDNYGFNLIEGSLSGPLLMRKDSTGQKTTPILGFFISGNFTSQLDRRPFVGDHYRLKPASRDALLENPLRPTGTGFGAFYNAEFLRADDFERVKFRQNNGARGASLAGKIDVNTGPNINVTFGGSMDYNNVSLGDWSSSLMNYDNFGNVRELSWRTYARFTQRFNTPQGEEGANKKIKNAFYSLMIDYSRFSNLNQDGRHQDNLFNYGYVGKFETFRRPTYEFDANRNIFVQNGFFDTLVRFTRPENDVNPGLSALTAQYFTLYDDVAGNYQNLTQIQNGRGLLNGFLPQDVYGMWRNLGYTYNNYSKTDNSQFRITGSGSANIGSHALTVGFEFEQRSDRFFGASPVGLWQLGRLLTNNHILELDINNPIVDYFGTYEYHSYNRLNAAPGEYSGDDAQAFFDYNLRNALGMNPDGVDFINLDAIDPNDLKLEFFSADELLNQGNSYINYFGFDHTGRKLSGRPSFDDFFTKTDEFGNFTREVGAFQPIYMSGYIMDKFAFDDLIFNVGVRIDRFDANQQVLRDEYLLYPARTVAEVTEFGPHPTNIPSNAIVYVNDVNDPTAINGYRVGRTWYNANGTEISDPLLIQGPNGIAPYLAPGVSSEDEISSNAFTDYKPQVIVMPRIAFSFPISDEALFFAHYDVLTKRPTTGNRLDPFGYYFMKNRSDILNNPNLVPEKTIDYELGFQQVLSRSSSLKVAAFYRELRDQVALFNLVGAYPRTYRTFTNIDFGTVKGMTIAYDLRKTGNLWMRAAYTLQFAEGTGSDAQSALNLVNTGQPNLRTIFPFNYDQRHQVVTTIDYRYGEGKDYNGPVWFDKQIFKNTGINFVTNLASGTPYSRYRVPIGEGLFSAGSGILQGTPNGSRKPWQFRADVQIDKNITLKFGEEGKKRANLNLYLLINNALNNRNVINVYGYTGNADDDGFLGVISDEDLQAQLDAVSFTTLYALKVNNPFNFGLPRTIRLGVKFDF